MKKLFFSALALFSMGSVANAQFSVYDNEGNVLYTMPETPAYFNFTYTPTKTPIETSKFYIVGDATPAGWNINQPYELTQSATDPYIYIFDGPLVVGEMKCPLTTGNWDCDCVMPITGNIEISSKGCSEKTFDLVLGGHPDKKWKIVESGNYTLTFNLRKWTLDIKYKTPIESSSLYLFGSATTAGNNISNAIELTRLDADKDVFLYKGPLSVGELKCPLTTGNSVCDYIMPLTDNVEINHRSNSVSTIDFDNNVQNAKKWNVTEAGNYIVMFNLRDWIISVTYNEPLSTSKLYIVGDGTPADWHIANPTPVNATSDPYIFTYSGPLFKGEMKCPFTTGNWGCDYIMPIIRETVITREGCENQTFDFVKNGSPDKKWVIDESGIYNMTFDLRNRTLSVSYVSTLYQNSDDEGKHDPQPTYTNPVWRSDFADPTVWKGTDGYFYGMSTNCEVVIKSKDLVNWEKTDINPFDVESKAQLQAAGWNLWAPDVATVNGKLLCYVACYNNAGDATICVTEEDPENPNHFIYVGKLTEGKVTGIADTIDPEVVTDETGRVWLFFGSINGIHRIELTSDGKALKEGAEYVRVAGLNSDQDPSRIKVLEGSYLYRHGGYWYLFVSSGWYNNNTYQMRVGRSATIDGDFVDKAGNSLLTGEASPVAYSTEQFYGPGHNGEIIVDDLGRFFITFHCHDTTIGGGGPRPMFLQELFWSKDGWPYLINDGKVVTEAQMPYFAPATY